MVSARVMDLTEEMSGKTVIMAGIVTRSKTIQTKRSNQSTCFSNIEDETGTIEAVVFPSIFEKDGQCFVKDSVVLVSRKVDFKDDKLHLIVDKAIDLRGNPGSDQLAVFGKGINLSSDKSISFPEVPRNPSCRSWRHY